MDSSCRSVEPSGLAGGAITPGSGGAAVGVLPALPIPRPQPRPRPPRPRPLPRPGAPGVTSPSAGATTAGPATKGAAAGKSAAVGWSAAAPSAATATGGGGGYPWAWGVLPLEPWARGGPSWGGGHAAAAHDVPVTGTSDPLAHCRSVKRVREGEKDQVAPAPPAHEEKGSGSWSPSPWYRTPGVLASPGGGHTGDEGGGGVPGPTTRSEKKDECKYVLLSQASYAGSTPKNRSPNCSHSASRWEVRP